MPAAHTDAAKVLMAVLAILEEQRPMTLRQLFYQLVSRQIIANSNSAISRLGHRLVRWRQEGTISWDAITVEDGVGEPSKKKPKNKTKKPQHVQEKHKKIIASADEGLTSSQIAADVGVGQRMVDRVKEVENARRDALKEMLGAVAAENFTDRGKLRIEDAIRIHKAHLDRQFEQRVNAEVRRRIDEADDAARKQNRVLRKENFDLQLIVGQRGVFTETQYRQMLMLCHPDNSASPGLRAALLQILVNNKKRLVKPDSNVVTMRRA
jgi:hypothetical protein